jgi:hypothetical protein
MLFLYQSRQIKWEISIVDGIMYNKQSDIIKLVQNMPAVI